MRNRVEQHDDDELSEILKLALRKESATTADLRQRLLAAADELGIGHESVAQAEAEYRQEASRKQELALYKKESRNSLRLHFGIYAIINASMVGLNLMTLLEDKTIWFPYVLLAWGMGLAIHAFITLREIDWDDEEFQKWRVKRAEERQS